MQLHLRTFEQNSFVERAFALTRRVESMQKPLGVHRLGGYAEGC